MQVLQTPPYHPNDPNCRPPKYVGAGKGAAWVSVSVSDDEITDQTREITITLADGITKDGHSRIPCVFRRENILGCLDTSTSSTFSHASGSLNTFELVQRIAVSRMMSITLASQTGDKQYYGRVSANHTEAILACRELFQAFGQNYRLSNYCMR